MQAEGTRRLSNIEIFTGLDDAELRRIEARCQWRYYRAGETILDRGGETREVLFIVEGAVNIVNFSLSGREVAYATLSAGDCVGELAAIDGQPRSASVVATESSLVAVLAAGPFLDLLQQRAEISFRLLRRLTHMVRIGDARIMELSTVAATQRVYAELLRMAEPDAAGTGLWVIRPLPPLREIASRVSTTRETVARALSQLYPTGLVRRKGRNLYLMDRTELKKALVAMQLGGSAPPGR